MRTDLTHGFPGVPALVQRARMVVETERRVQLRGAGYGFAAAIASSLVVSGLVGAHGDDWIVGVLFGLTVVWGPVALAYIEAVKLDPSLVADARAVLDAWSSARADWALSAVSGTEVDVQAEVAGWTRMERERRELPVI